MNINWLCLSGAEPGSGRWFSDVRNIWFPCPNFGRERIGWLCWRPSRRGLGEGGEEPGRDAGCDKGVGVGLGAPDHLEAGSDDVLVARSASSPVSGSLKGRTRVAPAGRSGRERSARTMLAFSWRTTVAALTPSYLPLK